MTGALEVITTGLLLLPALFVMAWFFLVIVFLTVGLLCFVFWVLMLIDCVQRKEYYSIQENGQLAWILIIVFCGVIGAILYYFLEKRKTPKQADRRPKPAARNNA